MPVRSKNSRMSESKSVAMPRLISALAETFKHKIGAGYKGRAVEANFFKIVAMADTWRDRLQQQLDLSGKSMRAVSLEAKCGAGYLHDILVSGKEPTVDRLMRVADVLGVSLSWLLYGIELSGQEERLLRLYSKLSPRQRQAILDLAATAD